MKSLIAAIQFITILPVGKPGAFEPKGVIQFFPVGGIIIGVLVSAIEVAGDLPYLKQVFPSIFKIFFNNYFRITLYEYDLPLLNHIQTKA